MFPTRQVALRNFIISSGDVAYQKPRDTANGCHFSAAVESCTSVQETICLRLVSRICQHVLYYCLA